MKKLCEDYFRMLIIGSTGCGKTFFLLMKLLPIILKNYTKVVIFTKSHNNRRYEKQIRKLSPDIKIKIVNSDYLEELEQLRLDQEENEVGENNEGDPIYGDNILIIWDDVLNEKLFKEEKFLDQFTNMRHIQVSTIILSQITNKVVSRQIKANVEYFVLFKLNHWGQQEEPLKLIQSCIYKKAPSMHKDKIKAKAMSIYKKNIMDREYGHIIISGSSDIVGRL